ncbi:DNA-binding transcriptional regulator, MocR family, contains an aminotransferase domain [Amycolatopsis tolypomycina]|uniref:DNA-binding transcriptional regulator, MocR family, contains an aminotransferase domain n=1 Tax=Amycolatopsis tolypomycina TaxID=208445 RepID=A0A1H4PRG5_9PSEU|nr:PLP-dependent aminotransferase family protein [Amycolatopsis tolypomycina]SEC10023.1 DNA-binding transcriptional regulator, MocR family, contains an aminotransferase domain [Amycolatopsis tolypomycina]
MDDYRVVADALAADIEAGRLRPGDRLPPQRRFARQRGIAGSTAARVYGELVRRGLAVGEVGRGTFVRAAKPPPEPALAEPGGARVDLELNFAVLPEESARLARALEPLLREDVLTAALHPIGTAGTRAAREAAAGLLARGDWRPDPANVLFTGNGRQALAASIAAFVPVGERLAVESLTYPVVKALAARLGVELVPIETDESGLVPEALAAAGPVRALYVQPTLHNPLGTTMPPPRRAALAEVTARLDLPVIEDGIYTFLRDDVRPFAAYAPERTVFVDSLSKRVAPGLTAGFLVSPPSWTARLASSVRSGAWAASRFAVEAATQWIVTGTLGDIEAAKRRDAAARASVVAEKLPGLRGDPASYHRWWELPEHWRADTFVAAAARRGIALSPAAAFAVLPGHAPNAVRIAVSAPPVETLSAALDVLAGLASGSPDDLLAD